MRHAPGRKRPAEETLTVGALILQYWQFAEMYYRKNGRPTDELGCIRAALRPLRQLYGRSVANMFGPLALKAVRSVMVREGRCRKYVNDSIGRIKRMYRWAVENEQVPSACYEALRAVAELRRGRSEARETAPVRPVPDVYVNAVLPFVAPEVAAMIELQRLTGMRAAEVTAMRTGDIEMSGRVWIYRPLEHKTEHHGIGREVYIGPKAQDVLRPFLLTDLTAFIFSPRRAEARRNAQRRAARSAPMRRSPARLASTNRKRPPGERYTSDAYRRAIHRGCDRADGEATKAASLTPAAQRIVPRWSPHRLRHNFGTNLRRQFGIEAASVLLGHRSIETAQIYAERNAGMAAAVIERVG